ncbi:MAG: hypothetical protein BGO49_28500 [Planctomycetales bacterium 71-10]|nr:MAG: hypothetical protein BGO49_28500 [Planctomycetales bacterium 71-10]
MTHETVHPVVGKSPTPESLFTPLGNVTVVRNLLRRLRPLVPKSMAAEVDVGLECLDELRRSLEARS